jgi:hypothetical protein
MTNEISDKTMVLVSRLGDFWINPGQAKKIMAIKEQKPDATLELQGNFISCRNVLGVLTAESYAALNHRRRGDWQCKYHQWHERKETCQHGSPVAEAMRKYHEQTAP